jgi:hypothetical protein
VACPLYSYVPYIPIFCPREAGVLETVSGSYDCDMLRFRRKTKDGDNSG